ncbi:MAG: cupin-like domain-containing protein, partial [Gammaproteobacteria bacterium]
MVVSRVQKRAESPESIESARPALRNRPGSIARREQLSYTEFFEEYVDQGLPVIVPGALRHCPALSRWNLNYLRARAGNPPVRLKAWSGSELRAFRIELNDYLDSIEDFESSVRAGAGFALERPSYLHDVPLVSILPEAMSDLSPFPTTYFPAWYRDDWWRFAQFFLGPSHSLTPLHFDTLL